MVDIEIVKLGNSLPCITSGMCRSNLRILRAASVHYSALRSMLYNVYHSRKVHATISAIDSSLQNVDTDTLRKLLGNLEYEEVINDAMHHTKTKNLMLQVSLYRSWTSQC